MGTTQVLFLFETIFFLITALGLFPLLFFFFFFFFFWFSETGFLYIALAVLELTL